MELVPTHSGMIPTGRRPVIGGYEGEDQTLYHALGHIEGVMVPGKTAEHLGGANFPFGGQEHVLRDNYMILCWKDN